MEHEVSDEDPNDNTIQEQRPDVIDLENDEEVLEDEMDEEEDDDSFGNDEEFEDEEEIPEDDDDDDVVVLSDGDDEPANDNDEESLNDIDDDDGIEEIEMVEESNNRDIEEVLGGEGFKFNLRLLPNFSLQTRNHHLMIKIVRQLLLLKRLKTKGVIH